MKLTDALAQAEKIMRQTGTIGHMQLVGWLKELATRRQDHNDLVALVRAQDRVLSAHLVLDQRRAELQQVYNESPEAFHKANKNVTDAKDSLCIQQARYQSARVRAQHILNADNEGHVLDSDSRHLIAQLLQPEVEHMCNTKLDELVASVRNLPYNESNMMSVWDKQDVSEQKAKAWFAVWKAFPELAALVKKMRRSNEDLRRDVQSGNQAIRKLTGELSYMEFENGLIKAHMDARTWLCEVECFNLSQHLVHMRAHGHTDEVCSNAAQSFYAVYDNARLEDSMAATRWACINLCR